MAQRVDHGTCGACRYWQLVSDKSADEYQSEGLCRRRAPVALPSKHVDYSDKAESAIEKGADDPGLLTAWPRTFEESDWCGDWEHRADLDGQPKVG
jgi:hypothetical protein